MKTNDLIKNKARQVPTTKVGDQISLDIGIEVESEVSGIGMGVLENGMAFLTRNGLAAMAGVTGKTISSISKEWVAEHGNEISEPGTRVGRLKEYLLNQGYDLPTLYIEPNQGNHHAYPDVVCMAVLDFFSFDSKSKNQHAVDNYRKLAAHGFRQFVYEELRYRPETKWKHFNDRVSILRESAPDGFFFVFNEIYGMVVDLINNDLPVNTKTIPDISVGQVWGLYWEYHTELAATCGDRMKAPHSYPNYYPQSDSNPQHVWAYPDSALVEFRFWFKNIYLPTKFPKYILRKAKELKGGDAEAKRIAGLFQHKMIK